MEVRIDIISVKDLNEVLCYSSDSSRIDMAVKVLVGHTSFIFVARDTVHHRAKPVHKLDCQTSDEVSNSTSNFVCKALSRAIFFVSTFVQCAVGTI
jgi:hypothetical protein